MNEYKHSLILIHHERWKRMRETERGGGIGMIMISPYSSHKNYTLKYLYLCLVVVAIIIKLHQYFDICLQINVHSKSLIPKPQNNSS